MPYPSMSSRTLATTTSPSGWQTCWLPNTIRFCSFCFIIWSVFFFRCWGEQKSDTTFTACNLSLPAPPHLLCLTGSCLNVCRLDCGGKFPDSEGCFGCYLSFTHDKTRPNEDVPQAWKKRNAVCVLLSRFLQQAPRGLETLWTPAEEPRRQGRACSRQELR